MPSPLLNIFFTHSPKEDKAVLISIMLALIQILSHLYTSIFIQARNRHQVTLPSSEVLRANEARKKTREAAREISRRLSRLVA